MQTVNAAYAELNCRDNSEWQIFWTVAPSKSRWSFSSQILKSFTPAALFHFVERNGPFRISVRVFAS